MIGAVVFVIAFVLFTLISLVIDLPPGIWVHDWFNISASEYSSFVNGIVNGVMYGGIIWSVFALARIGRKKSFEGKIQLAEPPEHPVAPADSFGREGDFFICSTCGRSFPISEISGQCKCGRRFCKECGSPLDFCTKLECRWIMCRYCKTFDEDGEYYHKACLPPKPTGCLVVTACFGSPLSKEVHYLKEIRDTKVLKTHSGKGIMEALEAVYYSFSPQVSVSLKAHRKNRNLFRDLVLSPLLKLLYVCERLSDRIQWEELRILGMTWLVFINLLGLIFWKIIPFDPLLKNKTIEESEETSINSKIQ